MTLVQHIDALIAGLTDWRGDTLAAVRKAILAPDPEVIEDWKYMGSPVWYRDGMIAVGNAHKNWVKLTFLYGASLPDPDRLFNAGSGRQRAPCNRFFRGDKVDAPALKRLVCTAIAFNQSESKKTVKATATKAL